MRRHKHGHSPNTLMPTTYPKKKATGPYGREYYLYNSYKKWNTSPRINGKLKLRANTYHLWRAEVHKFSATSAAAESLLPTSCPSPGSMGMQFPASVSSEAYARFRGKIYKGSSALGVTLASVKQSQNMIVARYQQLDRNVDRMAARFTKHVGAGRMTAKQMASIHLEVIFGWVPLLTDIHAATTSVIQLAEPKLWVRAKAQAQDYAKIERKVSGYDQRQTAHVKYVEVRSAAVSVSNPNLWLAERAGLLNPAAVAWDLVPWSFVVNMFVNTGQLVSSLTDFSGLSFTDASTTQFTRAEVSQYNHATMLAGKPQHSLMSGLYYEHKRSGGSTARPPVTWHLPELSFGTVALAASLFTQKFSTRLSHLVRAAHRIGSHHKLTS